MGTSEDTIGPEQRLALIESMMAEGQKRFVEDGKIYVVWGSVIVAASALHWLLVRLTGAAWVAPAVWVVMFGIGFLLVWRVSFKLPPRSKNRVSSAINAVWLGTFISLGLVMALLFTGRMPLDAYFSVLCIILGLAYWAVSPLVSFRSMRYLACVWWLGGVLCAFLPTQWSVLALNALVILCEIVPGIVMLCRAARARDAGES